MSAPGVNPARFSESVLAALRQLIPQYVPGGHLVFDPFAGEGQRLARLCQSLGYRFEGNDLEVWADQHPSVRIRDSTLPESYPRREYVVVTSPTYNNGMNDGFTRHDGTRGITYTFRAGHPLHPNNTGRWSGRSSKAGEKRYWDLHEAAVACWNAPVALVNIKNSIRGGQEYPLDALWANLLNRSRFVVAGNVSCEVPGNRYGSNRDARVDSEVILVAFKVPG